MGRNLSPSLSEELANLGKDDESTKSAMKALKSYLKDLDSNAIPHFLAKVSETNNVGSLYGEHTISLYEVLARVHGPKIVSHLDDIMSAIIKALTTCGGSFHLQHACSKVVPAIARYGIEPTMSEDKKRHVIHSLCKPLSDSLLSSQESMSCGASLCLKALVDCDNWRFTSNEMVNEVCLNLAGALKDTLTQTNSHMGLAMSLAKKNSFVVEAYAGLLVDAGLHILNCGLTERNFQKCLTSIQMLNFLMKFLDIRSILSEVEMIIEEMEKCRVDENPSVEGAAFETLQTAKTLLADRESKITDFDVVSMTGSDFGRIGNSPRRNSSSAGSLSPLSRLSSPLSGSSESQTLNSFAVYESYMHSPVSTCQTSCNVNHSRTNVNKKLWRGNGSAEIPLDDGNFSQPVYASEHDKKSGSRNSRSSGYIPGNRANGKLRSQTPSPQRREWSPVTKCDDNGDNSDYYDDQVRGQWSPVTKCDECGCLNGDDMYDKCEEFRSGFESVSSTEDVSHVTITDALSHNKFLEGENHSRQVVKNSRWRIADMLIPVNLVIFVAFAILLLSGSQDRGNTLVPT